jgi:phage tail-like protein
MSGIEARDDRAVMDASETGVLITPVMDSLESGNVWQRFCAQAELPEGAEIVWRFYAADREDKAREISALPEGEDALSVMKALAPFQVFRQSGTMDFLLDAVRGRYCVVSAELYRPEGTPPIVIHSIQVYCALESFLKYLPEIYADKNGFLDRFLRLFSVPYLELERKIDALYETFDPRAAPPDMLYWLAGAMGIPHAELWKPENLRELLVSGLYRRKGRISALAEFVRQYTGLRPFVCENFRMLNGDAENDRHYTGGEITLFLPPQAARSPPEPESFDRVTQSFLPCGVTYKARILDQSPGLSDCLYLGINTRLSDCPAACLGISSRLNFASLGDLNHNGEHGTFPAFAQ